jgi:tRNA-specific 2-thiouridylase
MITERRMKSKGKVLLGMSGGVDSSVSAYILKQQGYEVIGCTMKLWFDENHNKYVSNIEDAKRVANTLDIPFHIFDMQEDFKKYVVNYFISEYESGRTPNPCVACNRYVKFEGLMEKAKELEIDYIATGHYAVVEKENDRYILKKSKDDSKDQTYFLYNLTQEQLSKAVFPLGSYKKTEIRDIAKQLGFNTANKPDSQEVCFIENNNHFEFVNAYSDTPTQKGEIVDIQGNVLGIHEGISKYTIGQRRGLGVVTGKPMFVIDIDGESNRVILGSNDDLLKKELIASNLNWVSIDSLKDKLDVDIKIRSTAKLAKGKISTIEENKVRVIFDKPQRAITKGQSVVFYKEDTVVGGGIIES